ncbi:hypothetical protein KKH03_05515 [Patescibacteria group bacterium]|nr:hypothetical protein [Patescibacteria group bacterium]
MTNSLMTDEPITTPASPAMSGRITAEQEKFHQTFKYCGAKHREFRNRCIGMLPRILEERIYEKKGFGSIGKYAGILVTAIAGSRCGGARLSQKQVGRALGLHRNYADKPALKKLLENGEAGLSKLARVASIATKDNQDFLANQVMLLPQKALETMARDFRLAQKPALNMPAEHEKQLNPTDRSGNLFQGANGYAKPRSAHDFVRAHKSNQDQTVKNESATDPQMARPLELTKLKLSAQNLEKLLELQEKGIDINRLITSMLTAREEEIAQEKANLSAQAKPAKSRYVKVAIKKLINKEYGDKCAKQGCQKPSTQTHHTNRFAMSQVHDPQFMAPLCTEHHQIAHSIDAKYRMKSGLS